MCCVMTIHAVAQHPRPLCRPCRGLALVLGTRTQGLRPGLLTSVPTGLDGRLMPGSSCIGKASDGGDIGCRYTREMIELVEKALELRAKGIIKF